MSEKLVKKLEKTKSRDFKEVNGDEIVKEAETLLLGAHDAELKVLETLGLDHQVQYDNMRRDDYRRTKKAEELYGNQSFTGSQIKELCGIYFLKMLPVSHYNGTIPSDMGRLINEFCKEKGVELRKECFFILAPVEQFENIKHVPRKADPILFYREPNEYTSRVSEASEKDVFTQVLNWGNDFSELRRFKYWFSSYDSRKYSDDFHMSYLNSTLIAIVLIGMSLLNGVVWDNFYTSLFFLIPAAIIMLSNSLSNPNINEEWNTNRI
jgi:hypothetical protein